VVANFETECEAYEEISEIMAETHSLIEDNKIDEMTDEELEDLAARLLTKFESFKRHSRQIYNQLKEIRKNYLD
jgi:hypothetical protein